MAEKEERRRRFHNCESQAPRFKPVRRAAGGWCCAPARTQRASSRAGNRVAPAPKKERKVRWVWLKMAHCPPPPWPARQSVRILILPLGVKECSWLRFGWLIGHVVRWGNGQCSNVRDHDWCVLGVHSDGHERGHRGRRLERAGGGLDHPHQRVRWSQQVGGGTRLASCPVSAQPLTCRACHSVHRCCIID